jgi:outer membrane protein TolC
LTEIEMNRASLEAASATVRLGRERLEGEQARFEVGRGTTRTVIETQRDLLLATVTELRAQVNLIKSHVQLDRATGTTLEKQQIQIRQQLSLNLQ